MSISSDDSSIFEDDAECFNLEEDELDYYAILNVARDASTDDINKAYKTKCLIFHPDRHQDDGDKKDAEKVFVILRKAHETLSDPGKRRIYDAVGTNGLDMNWQLMIRTDNPENIRRQYEFLKKLRETEIMLQKVHPTGSFHAKINAAGLFCEDPQDRYMPSMVGISINQTVDTAVSADDRVGLTGKVKAGNGRGDGQFALSWKHAGSPTLHIEAGTSVAAESITSQLKITKAFGPTVIFSLAPSIQYFTLQEMFGACLGTSLSMQLTPNWQGSVAFSAGTQSSYISTTLMRLEYNRPKFTLNLTLSPENTYIRTTYMKRFADDGELETTMTLGAFGVIGTVQFEKKFTSHSKLGCGLTVAYPQCMLTSKIRLKTGFNHYEMQFVLCESPDEIARSVILGVGIPYVAFHTMRLIFRKPLNRLIRMWDGDSLNSAVDETKREEAGRISNLMRPTAERIIKQETERHGLVLVEAKYGQMKDDNTAYPVPGEKMVDVTVPLQAMVADSQLRVYSVKAQLPGFYDPCPGEPKMLKVVYRFHDKMHAVAIPEEMPLNIPLSSHLVNQ